MVSVFFCLLLLSILLLLFYQLHINFNGRVITAYFKLLSIWFKFKTIVELFKFSSFTLQLYIMNFLNLPELIQAVSQHEQFQHEIKGKRIKKELSNLEEYHNEQISFQRYFISSAGLSFFVNSHSYSSKYAINTGSTISKFSSIFSILSTDQKSSTCTIPVSMHFVRIFWTPYSRVIFGALRCYSAPSLTKYIFQL